MGMITSAEFDGGFRTNVYGTIYRSQALLKEMNQAA